MRSEPYKVEYKSGDVRMIPSNILVQDTTDMETIEFWESRLKGMNQPFAVVYRTVGKFVFYSIFTDLRKKGSVFR